MTWAGKTKEVVELTDAVCLSRTGVCEGIDLTPTGKKGEPSVPPPPRFRAKRKQHEHFKEFARKPRSEYGLDCRARAIFARMGVCDGIDLTPTGKKGEPSVTPEHKCFDITSRIELCSSFRC